MRTKYETVLGGAFLAGHYSDNEQVAYRAYYEMVSGSSMLVEKRKLVMAYRYAKQAGELDILESVYLVKRAQRMEEQAVTQRKWQGKTRRAGRCNHHDSLAIRDRYVTGRA